ncbi:MAG TPA: HNH endonuclease [Kofleriaceae bacterium]|nr:HNH endonuclease [Kofleriaceae bacterium]
MVGKATRPDATHSEQREQQHFAGAATPGRRTRVEELIDAEPSGGSAALQSSASKRGHEAGPVRRLDLGSRGPESVAGNSQPRHSPARKDVAEVRKIPKDQAAVIKVVGFSEGKPAANWQAKGRWEGPLPATFRGTKTGAGWAWMADKGMSPQYVGEIRVLVGAESSPEGLTLEQWGAKHQVDQIVFYARSPKDVALDKDAVPDHHAPGSVDQEDAGDGSSNELKREHKADAVDGAATSDAGMHEDPGKGVGKPSDADERLADEFERELGIDSSPADTDHSGPEDRDQGSPEGTSGGKKPGGKGVEGGAADGRSGDDTRLGGAGPGGAKARRYGDGRGSPDGGTGGSKDGSKDGQKHGDPDGMYGGEGEGEGVPSALALFGGLIGVPARFKGAVELALIISNANVTNAGKGLFKETVGRFIGNAAQLRRLIAKHARLAAARETKAAIKQLASHPKTAGLWASATKAERLTITRRVYWENLRKHFAAYEQAAKEAEREAKTLLKKAPKNAEARRSLEHAETAQEAAKVKPVAGRLPQNHVLAGKSFPIDELPPKYRSKGLRFTDEGYPDFTPHAKQLPTGKKYVEIEYTGKRADDFGAANKKAKLDETPEGWTWHHLEDGRKMMLVPTDLHQAVKHTGGVAKYKHATGVDNYD